MSLSRSYFISAGLGSALLATLAVHSQAAYAQATETSGIALEEIIVTAQKREQKLGDVGATIDVATGKELRTLGVTDVSELASVVPGFTYAVRPARRFLRCAASTSTRRSSRLPPR